MTQIFYTLISKILTILFSLVLGIIAFVVAAYYYPEHLEQIQIYAGDFKNWVLNMMTLAGSTPSINVWVRQLLGDEQIVFLFFVIIARVFLYLMFISLFNLIIKPLMRKKHTPQNEPIHTRATI